MIYLKQGSIIKDNPELFDRILLALRASYPNDHITVEGLYLPEYDKFIDEFVLTDVPDTIKPNLYANTDRFMTFVFRSLERDSFYYNLLKKIERTNKVRVIISIDSQTSEDEYFFFFEQMKIMNIPLKIRVRDLTKFNALFDALFSSSTNGRLIDKYNEVLDEEYWKLVKDTIKGLNAEMCSILLSDKYVYVFYDMGYVYITKCFASEPLVCLKRIRSKFSPDDSSEEIKFKLVHFMKDVSLYRNSKENLITDYGTIQESVVCDGCFYFNNFDYLGRSKFGVLIGEGKHKVMQFVFNKGD